MKFMSENSALSPKRQLLILISVAAVAFGVLLFFQRDTLEETWTTLINADLRFVLLLPIIQIINYYFIGQYYRNMFAEFNTYFSQSRAWGVVAAMNFVNQVLPSGGLSGITYLAYGFRSKLATGKTTLIQLGRYIFAFGSYAIIGPLALFLLVKTGRFDQFSGVVVDAVSDVWAIATFAIFILIGAFFLTIIFNQRFARRVGRRFMAILNWVKQNVLRRKKPIKLKLLRRMYREFREGVNFIRETGWSALRPAFFMLLSVFAELAIVYTALVAVTEPPSIGVVFISFVAANVVGVVSVIPGDVGVHEATVILVLAAFGVPEAAAISATLLYRVFNKFIFLPIGFYFYAKILKPATQVDG